MHLRKTCNSRPAARPDLPPATPAAGAVAAPLALAVVLLLALAAALDAQRVPGEEWLRYEDVAEAGFDPVRLDAARASWEALPSSAFMVVSDGAVVAAWGDMERRFMGHSVRKSFLSALYGIYYDRGEVELNKRLSDLGIDDYPDPLLATEREARILDLLKARSGVFHPAAYAGRTDSRPRGSEGPGRYFAYNNWDFNTLALILRQETGAEVFTAFDEHFGRPLGMEDWRVSDGYYHYELDKSRYPAYPFRMSTRDAARFGLLFAREGLWGDTRILSRNWVRRSTAEYSIDDDIRGYGFMWWTYREPRFQPHGMYSAIGVGNQMIAVLPDLDLVIVNRADTFHGERTPLQGLLDLVEQVLEARTGQPVVDPVLVPLERRPDPLVTHAPDTRLESFVGEWPYPASPLGLPERTTLELRTGAGHLVAHSPVSGTFRLYLQPDGTFHAEDSHVRYRPIYDDDGAFAGFAEADHFVAAAIHVAAAGQPDRARELLDRVAGHPGLAGREGLNVEVGRAVVGLLGGDRRGAERSVRRLMESHSPQAVLPPLRSAALTLAEARPEPATRVAELVVRLYPENEGARGLLERLREGDRR